MSARVRVQPDAAQGLVERAVAGQERIARAGVQPDRRRSEQPRMTARSADHVMAREVLPIVERAWRGLAAGLPERRRVCPDGAEPVGVQPGDVQRPEAAHADAADGHALRVGRQLLHRSRDHLVEHVARPLRAAPVVPVAVVAAVGEHHRGRAVPQRAQRLEELVVDVRVLPLVATAVQEHQQRPAFGGAVGLHERHRQAPVREAALDRDVPQLRPARVDREDVVGNDRPRRRRTHQHRSDTPPHQCPRSGSNRRVTG